MTDPDRLSPTLHTAIGIAVDQFAGDILRAAAARLEVKARILAAEGHPLESIIGWYEAAAWQRQQATHTPPVGEEQ